MALRSGALTPLLLRTSPLSPLPPSCFYFGISLPMYRPKQSCQSKQQCAGNTYKGRAGPSTNVDVPVLDGSIIPQTDMYPASTDVDLASTDVYLPEDLSPRPKLSPADQFSLVGAQPGVHSNPRGRSINSLNSP